jgi:hypothetical protein
MIALRSRVAVFGFKGCKKCQYNLDIVLNKKDIKNAEFHADFKSVEYFLKCALKIISKPSGNSALFPSHFCE